MIFIMLLVSGDAPRSAVRLLYNSASYCSAVALSPTRALTAAHCLDAEHPGLLLGPDLAEVRGRFDPPYARPQKPQAGESVILEGFGCDPGWFWLQKVPRLSMRPARILLVERQWYGLEVLLLGRVCGGDSGGAIWANGGGLVGIITARSDGFGYGTLIP